MLDCSYCDYYSVSKGKKVCEFSGHLFTKNPLEMDIYPCGDKSYDSYLLEQEEKKDHLNIVA